MYELQKVGSIILHNFSLFYELWFGTTQIETIKKVTKRICLAGFIYKEGF